MLRQLAPRAIIALLFSGCGLSGPAELAYPHGDEAIQDDDTGVDQSGPSAEPPGSGGSSSSGSSGTTSSSSSGTTSSSAASSGSGGGGGNNGGGGGNEGGGQCTPESDDGPCVACTKLACCAEVQACAQDANCSCWVGCMEQTLGDVTACIGQCGALGAAIGDLLDCGAMLCAAECGP